MQLYALKLTLQKKILTKSFWVSWGVIFKGLGVQMMPRKPAGYVLHCITVLL